MGQTGGVGGVSGSTTTQFGGAVEPGTGQPAEAPGLLPEPGSSTQFNGDVMTQLAELLTRASQQDKKSARDLENKANEAQAKADEEHVAQMRAKAEADKAAGMTEAWGDIVAGGLTLGSAFCSAKDIGGSQAGEGASNAASATKAVKSFDWWKFGDRAFQAGAKGATGTAKLISTNEKNDAENANVEATSAENASRAAERTSKSAHEDVQDAREAIKKVAEFLEKMQQAANGAMQTAAAYRA